MDKGTGEASTEPGFLDIKNPLGKENSLLLRLERMIWMGRGSKIFSSLLDEVVHYSIGRFNLGIIFGFLLLFLFPTRGLWGSLLFLLSSLAFHFSLLFFSRGVVMVGNEVHAWRSGRGI